MSHYLPALVRFPTSSQCLAHIYFVGFWSPYLIPAGCNRCSVHTIGPHRYPVRRFFTPLPAVTDRLRSPAPKAPDAEPQPLLACSPADLHFLLSSYSGAEEQRLLEKNGWRIRRYRSGHRAYGEREKHTTRGRDLQPVNIAVNAGEDGA